MAQDERRLEVWRTFLQSHAAITELLAAELQDEADLSLHWYEVLLHLHTAGGEMRMQDLARSVLLSKSGLTRLVDRLEDAGHVTRRQCPSDRRGTLAALTPSGVTALRAASPTHLRGIDEHFTSLLPASELKAVESFLRRVLEHLESERSDSDG